MAKKKGGTKHGKTRRPRQIPRSATFREPKEPASSPRSQTLPGMDQVRSRRLDNICEAIADCRERMNTARTEETQLDASALQTMVKAGIPVYRHSGIELARIPGAEKLRVRVTKETGDADERDLEQPDDGETAGSDSSEGANAE